MTESFPVKAVRGIERWIGLDHWLAFSDILIPRASWHADGHWAPRLAYASIEIGDMDAQTLGSRNRQAAPSPEIEEIYVKLIRQIYDKKIGELGTHWSTTTPIEFKYAKIKIGDVVDYYTTKDGVLEIPTWASFKFAVDEYLEEAPHIKFHPSRVHAFIDQNGVERLGEMD